MEPTMSPTMRPVPAMHPSRLPLGFSGDGGTTSATGLPKRVTRIDLRVLRTSSKMPRHLALNSEMATSFISCLYHGQRPWSTLLPVWKPFERHRVRVFLLGPRGTISINTRAPRRIQPGRNPCPRGISGQSVIQGSNSKMISSSPKFRALLIAAAALLIFVIVGPSAIIAQYETASSTLPLPTHIVVVVEENHGYSQIIGSSQAPYINTLATEGALFTNSHALTHPSEPNYLAFFSGSTQGVTDDSCPHTFSAANLGSELIAAKKTFIGYSKGLPSTGSTVCTSGEYARKHAPWRDFSNGPSSDSVPFSIFPTNYANLPTISWVIPNLLDDMHDGTIQQGDSWLQTHLQAYVTWAKTNNSLLIVTFDEDQGTTSNQIATIFVGP